MPLRRTKVSLCPLCKRQDRDYLFSSTRDGITSKIYRCKHCKLVYNGIRAKNVALLHDKFVGQYDQAEEFERWKQLYHNKLRVIERLINKTPKKKKCALLEVGCGPGAFLAAAVKRGWNAVGVEPYKPSYELARKRNLPVRYGDLKSVSLPDKSFDLIVAIEVVEHFIDPIKEFKQINKLLKDDGTLIIQTANVESWSFKLLGPKTSYFYYDHAVYLSPKTMKPILTQAGLKVVRIFPDELQFKDRIQWCRSPKEKLYWTMFYLLRTLTLRKPVLGTMTLYLQKQKN